MAESTLYRIIYAGAIPLLALASILFYRAVNRGLSKSAIHQQNTRLSVASVLAMTPAIVSAPDPLSAPILTAFAISIITAITFPLLYHLTYRSSSPDYDNYMDIAFGMYLFGALSALISATSLLQLHIAGVIIAWGVECAAVLMLTFQWGYYFLYNGCINTRGMKIFYETHYNEVIEFVKSFPPAGPIALSVLLLALLTGIFLLNLSAPAITSSDIITGCVQCALCIALTIMMFGVRRSPFRRCGLQQLYLDVAQYARSNRLYLSQQQQRLDSLAVRRLVDRDPDRPHTILLVIGESAARDYMSAFTTMDADTTPWMRQMAQTDSMILYPNAYSCAMHTVESLERALTQRNQYNNLQFLSAPSIIDIARKLGYRIHWYSNQGHLGANDTPVTLVAETADVAKWTRQQLNKVQYDEALLDFLPELDPTVDNLLVIHLKGSHFNFLNRYPAEHTVWGTPGVQDNIPNYFNSLHYTDTFLHRLYDYCVSHLNLDAMIYVSDHATIPSRQRTPDFDGFGHIRIPLAVWLSERYRRQHPDRACALDANRNRFFTNDLLYELMCGIFDINPDAFDTSASLAYDSYRFTPETLRAFNATIPISSDPALSQNRTDDNSAPL